MSWVTIIWSMVAAACLTLAVVQGLVWFQRRSQWVHLLFALAAIGTAGLTFCELWLMQAETIGEAVVLSVNSKSSVALVVSSYREIAAGDHIEAE